MLISKYTYTKYLYLAPGVSSTYILSIVHTYYSRYLYSVHLYYSTLVLEYLYLSSTSVPTTIIGRAELTFIIYLYSLSIYTHSLCSQICNNRVSNKQRGKPNKTNYLDFLTFLALLTNNLYC